MDTNRVAALLVVGIMLAMAGCTQLVTGEQASFAASEAGVDDYEEKGFAHNTTEWQNITRTVEAAGQEREITVSNRVETYLNESGEGDEYPEAAFALVTSPQVQIAGQPMSPVSDWDNEDILEEFGGEFDEYGEIESLDEEDEETMEVLGTETEVTTFEATVENDDGEERQVILTVTKFQHEGDFIIAIGAHDVGDSANADAIEELYEDIER